MPSNRGPRRSNDAIMISPSDLIGAATVARLLGIDRSNVLRGAQEGRIPYLAQLDGPGTPYVFDINEINSMKEHP